MKRIFIAFIFLSSLACDDKKSLAHAAEKPLSHSDKRVVGHQPPLPNELLKNPLQLSGPCSKMHITEWKQTRSKSALLNISKICTAVSNRFYPFVKSKGYTATKKNPDYDISILPSNKEDGGLAYRGLNDTKYRFKFRNKVCGYHSEPCEEGQTPVPVNGYIEYSEEYIYIRNDVSERFFERCLAHELFHMFSHISGVQNQEDNHLIDDEKLAYEFTDKYWPNN